MKFYCDEMLIRLGRWLRAAGYDTLIAEQQMSDRDIVQQARREGRKLITRDRKMAEYRDVDNVVVLLQCKKMSECIAEVTQALNIDWLTQPFTRCTVCNSILHNADEKQITELNRTFKKSVNKLYYCPVCDRLYWDGSHVKRMRHKLTEFNHVLKGKQN